MVVKTPAAAGSQVVEFVLVALEGNNEMVSVTMLSQPKAFVSIWMNTPTSDGLHDDELINIESCAE